MRLAVFTLLALVGFENFFLASAGNESEPKVAFNEYESKENGEYTHEIEFENGVRHKEEGKLVKGEFQFRGFFYDKKDPNVFHVYVKNSEGFHYYPFNIKGEGAQAYGAEDEEETCTASKTSQSCISPGSLLSLIS